MGTGRCQRGCSIPIPIPKPESDLILCGENLYLNWDQSQKSDNLRVSFYFSKESSYLDLLHFPSLLRAKTESSDHQNMTLISKLDQ